MSPGPQISVHEILLIVEANDVWAKEQCAAIEDIFRKKPHLALQMPVKGLEEVLGILQNGKAGLVHSIAHSNVNSDNPDSSMIRLNNGFLQPDQISGAARVGLSRSRPFVFFNSPHTARIGAAVAGPRRMAGWVPRLLGAGVPAFAGTLWENNAELAGLFARELYTRLWELPLAEAFHAARLATRDAAAANSTWLAYVLYCHPEARVVGTET